MQPVKGVFQENILLVCLDISRRFFSENDGSKKKTALGRLKEHEKNILKFRERRRNS
jgi:hypothetical protein